MWSKSFVFFFYTALSCRLSFCTADLVVCPGKCEPPEAHCETSSETDLCGQNLKCCLDESKDATRGASEPHSRPSVDAETKIRFEVKDWTRPVLSTIFHREPVEGASPDSRQPREQETLTCPGTCISAVHKPFCGHPFTYYTLCSKDEVCCLSEKAAFKITVLLRESAKDSDSEAASKLKHIFQSGEIGDLDYLDCRYHCVFRNRRRCLVIDQDQYCPGTTVCCLESVRVPAVPAYEDCKGRCVPPQLQDWCRPPQVLTPANNCQSPTLCCESKVPRGHRSDSSFHVDEEKEYVPVSPRGSSYPPITPALSRLWEASSGLESIESRSSRQVFQIPFSYSSNSFLISEGEGLTQIEADMDVRPLCPGSCLSQITKFLCLKNYTTYDGFYCPGKSVCCAKIEDVRRHEKYLIGPYPFLRGAFSGINLNCGKKGRKEETPEVLPGEWCWQAAIIDVRNRYLCGGALMDKSWAITTAQCIAEYSGKPELLVVRAGVNDLESSEENAAGQTIQVSKMYFHYSYDPDTLDNDIALLKLQTPLNLNANVCLICLPRRPTLPRYGELCTLTGYGFISKGDLFVKMTEAQIPIIHDLDCISDITQSLGTSYVLPASSFCAGHEENYCQGTCGNSLVCKVDDHYELIGLVSWAIGCQARGAPSVFVKISALLDWINYAIGTDRP